MRAKAGLVDRRANMLSPHWNVVKKSGGKKTIISTDSEGNVKEMHRTTQEKGVKKKLHKLRYGCQAHRLERDGAFFRISAGEWNASGEIWGQGQKPGKNSSVK